MIYFLPSAPHPLHCLYLCETPTYLVGWHCHPACTRADRPSAASRPWMSGVLTGFFRPEWPRLSGLGAAPARSYRICMLDVFGSGQGWHSRCRGNRLPLSALPGTSQTLGFPSKRPEPLPQRPEHAPYRCPQPLPGGAGLMQTAAKVMIGQITVVCAARY